MYFGAILWESWAWTWPVSTPWPGLNKAYFKFGKKKKKKKVVLVNPYLVGLVQPLWPLGFKLGTNGRGAYLTYQSRCWLPVSASSIPGYGVLAPLRSFHPTPYAEPLWSWNFPSLSFSDSYITLPFWLHFWLFSPLYPQDIFSSATPRSRHCPVLFFFFFKFNEVPWTCKQCYSQLGDCLRVSCGNTRGIQCSPNCSPC